MMKMEMWLKRASLVLLTVAAAAMVILPETSVFLNDTEEKVEVPNGSTLTLYCCLETYHRSWISWNFISSRNISNSGELSKKMINRSASTSVTECKDRDKAHSLLGVNETHSGWYFCEVSVDIPQQMTFFSKRTEVVITSSMTAKSIVESTTSYVTSKQVTATSYTLQVEWWIWVLVGVSVFVLVILTVVCILLRRCCSRDRAEDPIYANTHSKQPSPGQPMNHLKTVSSSQNLRVPSPGQRYDEGKRRHRH
ncbi:uncharacterized protein LOC103369188 [Stegastes partitus]|uniref:Uncharacterized protein LOC103369188 n=1 Tax=Stegastes partitus TaxID=144197 RepID=A0A9Y4TVR8_9TELE|nr:PREDICTED: uncharacterized protein LOC103369188 [Stegastes partitus]